MDKHDQTVIEKVSKKFKIAAVEPMRYMSGIVHNVYDLGKYVVKIEGEYAEALEHQADILIKPVLIHTDAHGDNLIITPQKNFVLVDWDNAKFGIALEDFTNLTAWFPISKEWRSLKQRAAAKSAFLKGYGNTGFSREEIAKLEKALHPLNYEIQNFSIRPCGES